MEFLRCFGKSPIKCYQYRSELSRKPHIARVVERENRLLGKSENGFVIHIPNLNGKTRAPSKAGQQLITSVRVTTQLCQTDVAQLEIQQRRRNELMTVQLTDYLLAFGLLKQDCRNGRRINDPCRHCGHHRGQPE